MSNSKRPEEDPTADIPRERPEPRPDFSKPVARKPLPKELQKNLEDDESYFNAVYEGTAGESTDTSLRYAAYANRLRTIMLAGQRYVAYTSDIGESFRPVAHPNWVRTAYGISWAYLMGDVGYEGYKAYLRNQRVLKPDTAEGGAIEPVKDVSSSDKTAAKVGESTSLGPGLTGSSTTQAAPSGHVVPIEDYRSVMAQRAVFQSIASMGLPAFTIHSIVRYSGQAFKKVQNPRIRTWGPIGLGLAAVPALPFIFDEPVEYATEWVFHKAFEAVGGPGAVGHRPEVGRSVLKETEAKEGKRRDKEL
ncbi:hypothetical protein MBLNU230_g3246t1 [Neophaeotheca triangularis]